MLLLLLEYFDVVDQEKVVVDVLQKVEDVKCEQEEKQCQCQVELDVQVVKKKEEEKKKIDELFVKLDKVLVVMWQVDNKKCQVEQ